MGREPEKAVQSHCKPDLERGEREEGLGERIIDLP